ncbi:AI-2E family transporter [Salinigranum rubrum]|uniref:AI-2E family transporter n=1 Tax=Salinigranum rubrum TaxID=755307 RepID=A0A2I8VPH7_9EURY|nr:AI-2E family transporter [Salinigranum rubrum]AUV83806.1 AI-2E family transporter [Salinigranum rubrum]
MALPRRYVLGGLLVVLTVVAAALLYDVIGTVFFAVTVAYLLVPVHEELVDRGLGERLATVVVTFAALVGVIAVVAPLVFLTASRLTETLALLSTLPATYEVEFLGRMFTIQVADLRASMVEIVRSVGQQLLVSLPVLLVKFTLFVFLVYSLLQRSEAVAQSLLAVVPPEYRRVAKALNRRARNTLFGIYILQAATAVGTFVIALPVFFLLGYDSIITLSTVAAILQFIPIVGPSLLLLIIAIVHVAAGQLSQALVLLAVGGFFVAWLPDILIRPRLSKRAANLSGGVYFIGFVGGLLSMGAIGIIAGPLIVALVVEAAGLLSSEFNDVPVDELRE